MNGGRDADPTWLSHRLEACGDVYAVAIEFVAFDDDVAEVQSDTHKDCAVFRKHRVRCLHRLADLDRALHRIDGARELGPGAVAHEPNDATAVLGKQRLDNYLTPVGQGGERTSHVLLPQAALADDHRRQDGRDAAR